MTHPALIERITRSLAYMLRHQPEEFDLEVDEFGYAEVDDVVRALNERLGESVDEEDVRDAVLGGDRQRYEIEGTKIRALYGHSIEVQPGEPSAPPAELYVGVSSEDADRARRHGLRAGRRRFLHLALTAEDAIESGRRAAHDYVVITVRAGDAWEEGINFYDRRSLFLSDPIPTEFLEVGEVRTDGFGEILRERGGRDDRPARREERGGHRGGRGHGHARHEDRPARAHQAPRIEEHAHEGEQELEHEGVHDDQASDVPVFGAGQSAAALDRPEGGAGGEQRPRGRRRGRGRGREQGGPPAHHAGDAPRHEYRAQAPREEHRPSHAAPRSEGRPGESRHGQPSREPSGGGPRHEDRPRHGGGSFDRPSHGDRPRREGPPREERPREERPREERPREERPRFDDRPPRREEAPRRDEAPRYDDRPRREEAPRYDDRPRREEAPRYDDRPRREEAPRHDDRPRRDEPARGGRGEHRPHRGHGEDRGGERRPSAPRHEESSAPAARGQEGGSFGGGMSEAPAAPRREPPRRAAEAPETRKAPEPRRERRPDADDGGGFGAGI